MYKNKSTIRKREVIPHINNSMITVDFYKFLPIINFTTHDMIYKFELFLMNKINSLYLTESMQTYLLQILDEYWK